ncbi:hypothetical protein C8R47DRAFT_1147650 [Mycena vitilis]|nr:hypothetical protein C8R47DRAFT_1147650 [Mycena vitilis]
MGRRWVWGRAQGRRGRTPNKRKDGMVREGEEAGAEKDAGQGEGDEERLGESEREMNTNGKRRGADVVGDGGKRHSVKAKVKVGERADATGTFAQLYADTIRSPIACATPALYVDHAALDPFPAPYPHPHPHPYDTYAYDTWYDAQLDADAQMTDVPTVEPHPHDDNSTLSAALAAYTLTLAHGPVPAVPGSDYNAVPHAPDSYQPPPPPSPPHPHLYLGISAQRAGYDHTAHIAPWEFVPRAGRAAPPQQPCASTTTFVSEWAGADGVAPMLTLTTHATAARMDGDASAAAGVDVNRPPPVILSASASASAFVTSTSTPVTATSTSAPRASDTSPFARIQMQRDDGAVIKEDPADDDEKMLLAAGNTDVSPWSG